MRAAGEKIWGFSILLLAVAKAIRLKLMLTFDTILLRGSGTWTMNLKFDLNDYLEVKFKLR